MVLKNSFYYFLKVNYKLPINRILDICFWDWLYHGVYQARRSGSPDIPRDKVSPKNKMPNILYVNGSPDIPRDKVSPKNKMANILYVLPRIPMIWPHDKIIRQRKSRATSRHSFITTVCNRNYSAILATLQITSYVHSRNSS